MPGARSPAGPHPTQTRSGAPLCGARNSAAASYPQRRRLIHRTTRARARRAAGKPGRLGAQPTLSARASALARARSAARCGLMLMRRRLRAAAADCAHVGRTGDRRGRGESASGDQPQGERRENKGRGVERKGGTGADRADVPAFGDLRDSRWAGVRTCFQLPAVLTTPANRASPSEVPAARPG